MFWQRPKPEMFLFHNVHTLVSRCIFLHVPRVNVRIKSTKKNEKDAS